MTTETMPKAIETVYKGYRFRSCLEARWAVFLDAYGVDYEYEKEGYDLGKDGWYLPDFWGPVRRGLDTILKIMPDATLEDVAEVLEGVQRYWHKMDVGDVFLTTVAQWWPEAWEKRAALTAIA